MNLFACFIIKHGLAFSATDELDALLAEWKNTDLPSKSEFEGALAGVEMVLPMSKGSLPWARSIAAAWNVCHEPKHRLGQTSCCRRSAPKRSTSPPY